MNLRTCFAFLALMLYPAHIIGQVDELPRHGVIGLAVAPADPSKKEDPQANPVTVKTATPGGAGAAAGIQAGDVLHEIDHAQVTSSEEFARRIGRHLAGDSIQIRLSRNGVEMTKTVTLKPRPFETSADADVLYRSVVVDGARRRVIITQPKSPGRHPAVLLMSGLGCYSLDGELLRDTGYGPFLSGFAAKGWVTMRVEKPGEGDSEGPPCRDPQATAELEAKAYLTGLRTLKSYDFVDPGQIFVFAHSLGPLIGSLVLPQEPVRGFIAAETIGRSWFEYGLENLRRQAALVGESRDQVDADVRAHAHCAYHFFLQHETAAEINKLNPQCKEMIDSYAGVPETFMRQIGDISLAKQWKQIDVPVLVLYGTSDPATSSDEGHYLTDMINSLHPGRATYRELPGMGHDFGRYASQLEFLDRRKDAKPHPFDTEALDVVLRWIDQQRAAPAPS